MTKVTTTIMIPDEKVKEFLDKQEDLAVDHGATTIIQSNSKNIPEGSLRTGVLLNEKTGHGGNDPTKPDPCPEPKIPLPFPISRTTVLDFDSEIAYLQQFDCLKRI